MRICYRLLSILFVCLFVNSVTPVSAQTGEVGFSVERVPHVQQTNDRVGYFDLLVKQDDETTLEVIIHNHASEDKTFDVKIGNGYTNENGVVMYDQESAIPDHLSFTELVSTFDENVTITSGESKRISFVLKSVNEDVNGVILGGIRVSETEERQEDAQVGLQNRYEYVIGVVLRTSVKQVPFRPEWKGVNVNQEHHYPHIAFQVMNTSGSISRDLDVQMTIRSDEQDVKLDHAMEAKLVPYTSTGFRFPLTKRLGAGTYQVEMTMTESGTGATWTWEDELVVSEEEAETISERVEQPIVEESSFFSGTWTMSLLALLLTAAFLYIVHLRRKLKTQ
ncbi:WxL protein peptidoglycan domain-containing protein [Exiguobacterium sp. NPDC077395]|uniref:DUF916 domain-containing protein n=1 Tax=Exiguobacterium sp. NPDC077395 TaxID=3390563 RepID=UPI003D07F8EB